MNQSVIDVGIKNNDIEFIYLFLIAQITLIFSKNSVEVLRSFIRLHLSTRVNISILSDFFLKLMNLPIEYFDTRMTGALMQRTSDHKRIEQILTTSSLEFIFSLFTFKKLSRNNFLTLECFLSYKTL